MHFSYEQVRSFFRDSLQKGNLYHTFLFSRGANLENQPLTLDLIELILSFDQEEKQRGNISRKIREGIHPDVFYIRGEGQKSISIDQIREMSAQAHIKPWESKHKIILLDPVDTLREEAANALLKILEEPPDYVTFFLIADNNYAVLPTITSRCQIFTVLSTPVEGLKKNLQTEHSLTLAEAEAFLNLGEVDFSSEIWERRRQMLSMCDHNQDPIDAGDLLAQSCGKGEDGRKASLLMLDYLACFWRDVVVAQHDPERVLNVDFRDLILQWQATPQQEIFFLIEFLLQAKRMVLQNISLGLIWENIFLKIHLGYVTK